MWNGSVSTERINEVKTFMGSGIKWGLRWCFVHSALCHFCWNQHWAIRFKHLRPWWQSFWVKCLCFQGNPTPHYKRAAQKGQNGINTPHFRIIALELGGNCGFFEERLTLTEAWDGRVKAALCGEGMNTSLHRELKGDRGWSRAPAAPQAGQELQLLFLSHSRCCCQASTSS